MADAQLQQFLAKVSALNAFVAQSEADPGLRAALTACSNHHEVVALARSCGFEIGRRWGEPDGTPAAASNLLGGALPPAGSESTAVLLQTPRWRLERIHSNQARSPDGFWYDQPTNEWVLVLRGAAKIEFEDGTLEMGPGDYVDIPAHKKHRVAWTTPDEPTVWLAVHYGGGD